MHARLLLAQQPLAMLLVKCTRECVIRGDAWLVLLSPCNTRECALLFMGATCQSLHWQVPQAALHIVCRCLSDGRVHSNTLFPVAHSA